MADLDLPFGGDLTIGSDGDLAVADGNPMTEQHILRRLFTRVQGYIWHLSYGTGLIQRIGKVATPATIKALVRGSLALEATVAANPVPTVTVDEDETVLGLFNIGIQYTSATTGESVSLTYALQTR